MKTIRRPRRADLRSARRKAHYLGKLAAAETPVAKVGVASDYVRAVLVRADSDTQSRVGEQLIGLLLSAVAALEPTEQRRGDRLWRS